jgi:protein TonB
MSDKPACPPFPPEDPWDRADRALRTDRRRLGYAVLAAALAHGLLFLLPIPQGPEAPAEEPPRRLLYQVAPMPRIKPPLPEPEPPLPPVPTRGRPVPVPEAPELVPEVVRAAPPIAAPVLHGPLPELEVFIAEAPPEPPHEGPYELDGRVQPPVKLHAPRPGYTERARRHRIQGVVVLRAVIDDQGLVRDLTVLRGLPLGLTEAALEATREWRFEPARLGSRPVAVFMNLAVTFQLQ